MGWDVGTLRVMSSNWRVSMSVIFPSRVETEIHSSRIAFQPRIHPELRGGVVGEMGLRDEVRILPGKIQEPGQPPSPGESMP